MELYSMQLMPLAMEDYSAAIKPQL